MITTLINEYSTRPNASCHFKPKHTENTVKSTNSTELLVTTVISSVMLCRHNSGMSFCTASTVIDLTKAKTAT